MSERPPEYSNRRLLAWAVGLTLAFELLTCILRFGFRLESTRDTASMLSTLTCGWRIHHSYIGGLMILIACCSWKKAAIMSWWLLALGLGLFFSDMIHHFLVLWTVVGSPQFDLTYPDGT